MLAEYQRLEAEAVWHPSPDAQRRDVIISIGKATITLSTPNGKALGHWSLPAIRRLNAGVTPALYGPGGDALDTLEVADPEMTEAIERVLAAIHKAPRAGGWVRRASMLALLVGFCAAMVIWLPGAITAHTASLVPEAARAGIGSAVLAKTERVAGTPCRTPAGDRALSRLSERLFPGGGTRFSVMPSALAETAHLPGGDILIGHRLVEDHETPDVLAGHLVAEDIRRTETDPLARLLAGVPFRASLAILSTGRLREIDLERMAEWVVATPPAPVSDTALLTAMKAKSVATAPFGYARDISGETTLAFVETGGDATPVLDDTDWIALQAICGE